ncbi:uncharacterized protein LOC121768590 [Salvia splendens]|uniref:uncharacterized protein LOC121768590 n=1 Tax=Salvia splendens TaxID=180675 RepID=UPI001C27D799|nr:uncharacterized protein LOC121768590 [Salvia splendens]
MEEDEREMIDHWSHEHPLPLVDTRKLEYCYGCEVQFGSGEQAYGCSIDGCRSSGCGFQMHLRCAHDSDLIDADVDVQRDIGKDMIHFPTNEVAEELITPFVMRENGGTTFMPPIIIQPNNDDELVNVKYKFLHHQHELTLVSSTSQHPQILGEEEDEENYGVRSELICDGCITPISSSSSKCYYYYYYYYMSCSECKYNLHMACFHLPPRLHSVPLHHHDYHHSLDLRSCDKLRPWEGKMCSVCEYPMNGLFYTCTKCGFKVDIQCACMPDTIHQAAHPRHLLKYVTQSDLYRDINRRRLSCAAGCGIDIAYYDCYSSRRWDKHHQLLLTYDATLNRPGDFYCDQCETQMNPRSWMYHCRACDISFHPDCFPTTSGEYRNKKLGQEYDLRSKNDNGDMKAID